MFVLIVTYGVLPALILFSIYHYVIVPAFLSPLSQIPHANWTSFCALWMWWRRRIGFENRAIYAAHQRNGPIVRLGPNEISVASLDGLRKIYTGGFDKDRWYFDEFSNYKTPNLVSLLDYQPHSIQKRMISSVYSKSYIQSSTDMQTLSKVLLFDRFLPLLQSAAENATPINVLELGAAASLDFMSAYLFGLTNSTNYVTDLTARQHYFQLWRTKRQGLTGAHSATKELESLSLEMCQAAEMCCQSVSNEKPRSSLSTAPVVYSHFSSKLSGKSAADPASSHPKNLVIASELMDMQLAAIETNSITITYAMYELSQNRALQSALRDELLGLSPSLTYPLNSIRGSESSATPTLPHPNNLDSLPLLDAILHETLRLYTANPGPLRRIVPQGGTTIESYHIPAGVVVSTSAHCMHRNADVFPEPEVFKPERWLQGDGKAFGGTEEMRRWFWAFGSGGRMCLGSHFALQVLKLLIASVYTNYTTSIIDDEGIEQMDGFVAGPVGGKLVLQFTMA